MKIFIRYTSMSALLIVTVLGLSLGSARSDEGTVQKIASSSDGYCHLKIPAARPSTFSNNKPQLKSSTTGDWIDFYGACDVDPTGKDVLTVQRHVRSGKWGKM
ncbi:MAG: hypothetical protein ACREQO_05270 [Candidatus Binatia bacterium]